MEDCPSVWYSTCRSGQAVVIADIDDFYSYTDCEYRAESSNTWKPLPASLAVPELSGRVNCYTPGCVYSSQFDQCYAIGGIYKTMEYKFEFTDPDCIEIDPSDDDGFEVSEEGLIAIVAAAAGFVVCVLLWCCCCRGG